MPFNAIYDACVLYPFQVRDILMVAAMTRLFTVYWTDAILDECTHNLIRDKRASHSNMQRLVADMKRLFPYATIEPNDYEQLIPAMTNHPKDRHVLAAAVSKNVNVIVTNNVRDFPDTSLRPYFIEVQTPDTFVSHVIDLAPEIFIRHFIENNELRRTYAKNNNKPIYSDKELAEQLAIASTNMPNTSSYLLELLA